MPGNWLVRFLGEGATATSPPLPDKINQLPREDVTCVAIFLKSASGTISRIQLHLGLGIRTPGGANWYVSTARLPSTVIFNNYQELIIFVYDPSIIRAEIP